MNSNLERIAELKAKAKLSPQEKGELAALERAERKLAAAINKEPLKARSNTFGTVATTKITPKPIRFLDTELTALATRSDTLKANCADLIIDQLGSLREVNTTKLIRAGLVLLMEAEDEEVIRAIKDVQMKMVQGN